MCRSQPPAVGNKAGASRLERPFACWTWHANDRRSFWRHKRQNRAATAKGYLEIWQNSAKAHHGSSKIVSKFAALFTNAFHENAKDTVHFRGTALYARRLHP